MSREYADSQFLRDSPYNRPPRGWDQNDYVAGVHVTVGFDLFNPSSYHEVVDNPGKVAAQAAQNLTHPDQLVRNAAHSLGPVLDVAKFLASNTAAIVSLVPGLGTPISSAISSGLALLEGGSPLDIAIHAAYGLIPIPPGLKNVTDVVVDALVALLDHPQDIGDAMMAGLRKATLDHVPDFARGIAGQVFDTLAHLILQAVGGKPTMAVSQKPLAAVHAKALQAAHKAGAPLPKTIALVSPTSKAHLALHFGMAIKAGAVPSIPPPKKAIPFPAHLAVPIAIAPPPPVTFVLQPSWPEEPASNW